MKAEGGVSSPELASLLVKSGWIALTKGTAAASTYGNEVGEHWRRRFEQGGGQSVPQSKGKDRVFIAEIGGWPKIWKVKDGPPAVYVLKARFSSPKGLKEARTIAIGGGVVLGLWFNSAITPPGATGGPFIVAAIISVFFGGLLYVVLHILLRLLNPFLGPSLHMTLTGAALEWKGYRRNWWGGMHKEKIFPNEARGEVRVVSHRRAPAELRKAQERVRAGRKEPRMFYQQASEVIIDAGPQGNNPLKVAEIANDEQGEKGGKIAGAIIIATRAAQGMGEPAPAEPGMKKKGGLFG
jgi:hypothetical protein